MYQLLVCPGIDHRAQYSAPYDIEIPLLPGAQSICHRQTCHLTACERFEHHSVTHTIQYID